MRITINAEDSSSAIAGMEMAMNFIKEKKDNDGTSDTWGYFHSDYKGSVTRKKNGNISVRSRREGKE